MTLVASRVKYSIRQISFIVRFYYYFLYCPLRKFLTLKVERYRLQLKYQLQIAIRYANFNACWWPNFQRNCSTYWPLYDSLNSGTISMWLAWVLPHWEYYFDCNLLFFTLSKKFFLWTDASIWIILCKTYLTLFTISKVTFSSFLPVHICVLVSSASFGRRRLHCCLSSSSTKVSPSCACWRHVFKS